MSEATNSSSGAGGSGERGVLKAGSNVPEAILYVTSNCHLCSVARALLVSVQRTIPFSSGARSLTNASMTSAQVCPPPSP